MRVFILLLVAMLATEPVLGDEPPRLRFLGRTGAEQTVSGRFTLRVSEDPFLRPAWVRIGIKLDGKLWSLCDTLPYAFEWDTTKAAEGLCEFFLVVLDTREKTERVVDTLVVRVANRAAPPVAVPKPPAAQPISPEPANPKPPALPPALRAVGPAFARAPLTTGTIRPEATPRPLEDKATALTRTDDRLYIGNADGGITVYDPKRRTGFRVGGPSGAHTTRALAAAGGDVWWLTTPVASQPVQSPQSPDVGMSDVAGPSPVEVTPHPWLMRYREADGVVTSFDLSAAPPIGRIPRLRFFESRLVIGDGARTVMLDATSGELLTTEGNFPPDYTEGERIASPVPLPKESRRDVSAMSATASGSDVWWVSGLALFHEDTQRGSLDAWMPWNEKGMRPRHVAADTGGAWVATDKDVRRVDIQTGAPGSDASGFIRIRLGSATDMPVTDTALRLAETIETWYGVPYVFGGASRKGVDCSGFVMAAHQAVGVDLPHGSAELAVASQGAVVRDELRYGDVLVYPGHCAIYIGDGNTAETVSSKVGNRSVWFRDDVVVRRFIDVPAQPAIVRGLPSRGGQTRRPGPSRRR